MTDGCRTQMEGGSRKPHFQNPYCTHYMKENS